MRHVVKFNIAVVCWEKKHVATQAWIQAAGGWACGLCGDHSLAKTEVGQKCLKITFVKWGQQLFLFSGSLFGGKRNVCNILRNEWACYWPPPEGRCPLLCVSSLCLNTLCLNNQKWCFPFTQVLYQKKGFSYWKTDSDCLLYMFKRSLILLIIWVKLNLLIIMRRRRIKFIKSPHEKCWLTENNKSS